MTAKGYLVTGKCRSWESPDENIVVVIENVTRTSNLMMQKFHVQGSADCGDWITELHKIHPHVLCRRNYAQIFLTQMA